MDFDDSDDDVDNSRKTFSRKSKTKCKALISQSFVIDPVDVDVIEDSEYDSFEDPEFEVEGNVYSDSDGNVMECEEKRNVDSDGMECDNFNNKFDDISDKVSLYSNMTGYNYYKDVLNKPRKRKRSIADNQSVMSDKMLVSKRIDEKILKMAKDRFINKDYEAALKACEYLRNTNPYHYIIYELTAEIYEAMGEKQNMVSNLYAACLMNGRNLERWIKCIDASVEIEGFASAIEKAREGTSRTEGKLRTKFIELLEKGGNEKEALHQKLMLYRTKSPPKEEEEVKEYVEELLYMREKFISQCDGIRACTTLQLVAHSFPQYLSNEQLINFVEELLQFKRFGKIIGVAKHVVGCYIKLTNFSCNSSCLNFSQELTGSQRNTIIYAVLASVVKKRLETIMRDQSFALYIIELFNQEIDKVNSILNFMMEHEYYEDIITLLTSLEKEYPGKKPLNIIMRGTCLEKLHKYKEALEVYDNALNNWDRKNTKVWQRKFEVLYKIGKEEEAEKVLLEGVDVLLSGMMVDFETMSISENTAPLLLNLLQHYKHVASKDEHLNALWRYIWLDSPAFLQQYGYTGITGWNLTTLKNDTKLLMKLQKILSTCVKSGVGEGSKYPYTSLLCRADAEKNWLIFKQVGNLILEEDDDEFPLKELVLEIYSIWGFILYRILDWNMDKRLEVSILIITASVRNRMRFMEVRQCWSHRVMFQEFMIMSRTYVDSVQFWNIYNLACCLTKTFNIRYMSRMLERYPNNKVLHYINGAYSVQHANRFSVYCCSEVMDMFPDNPHAVLHTAITLSRSAISRNCLESETNAYLAQCLMLKYEKLRGPCQETYFNLGRFYHGCNKLVEALDCYNKCLETEASDPEYDMKNLAAHNLYLIYKSRECYADAIYIRDKYLVYE